MAQTPMSGARRLRATTHESDARSDTARRDDVTAPIAGLLAPIEAPGTTSQGARLNCHTRSGHDLEETEDAER